MGQIFSFFVFVIFVHPQVSLFVFFVLSEQAYWPCQVSLLTLPSIIGYFAIYYWMLEHLSLVV